jgi:hypothetical protein
LTWPLILIVAGSLLKIAHRLFWEGGSPHRFSEIASALGVCAYALGWQSLGAVVWLLAAIVCFVSLLGLKSSILRPHGWLTAGTDTDEDSETALGEAIRSMRAEVINRAKTDEVFREVCAHNPASSLVSGLRDKPFPKARGTGHDQSRAIA